MNAQSFLRDKRTSRFILIFFGLFFCLSFYLNFSREPNAYFTDLRNRIVGARLLKQDTSVYYYKWDSSQPLTLCDPYDKCNIRNNMITSPPSVLLLMQPVADLNYSAIARLWIILHYVFFLIMIGAIYYSVKDRMGKNLLLLAGCLLLFSGHWQDSVFRGQSHFIFPALLALTLWLATTSFRYRFLYVGLIIALLVWIRPNALLIVPFLFLCQQINRRQLFGGLAAGALLFGLITVAAGHVHYWIDFYHSCREWIANNTAGITYHVCNKIKVIEGKTVRFAAGADRVLWPSEISNMFHLVRSELHFSFTALQLNIIFLLTYVVSLLLFYKMGLRQFSQALFAGILLYWFSEISAPILRMSYYYVELFVVVLFLAGTFPRLLLREKLLLGASFLFTFLSLLPMHLTIAEFCTIACVLSYISRNVIIQPAHGSHDTPARY